MRAGSAHTSERRRSDGRVIELRGQPLPDGGFVTTFSDVTSHKRPEESLREINETLELRVEERTRQLAAAVAQAEQANQSKTRFVIAASHDLLQPLGAARLFNAALRSRAGQDGDLRGLAERVDNSLAAAGELLEGLLDISRLDAGGVRAEITEFDVGDLLNSLLKQFAPVAAQRGIRLVVRLHAHARAFRSAAAPTRPAELHRQRVALHAVGQRGARAPGAAPGATVELQVIDTGPGIRRKIAAPFSKSSAGSISLRPGARKGLGLGLSICERIAAILDSTLMLESTPGRGSIFGIRVPRAGAGAAASFSELAEHSDRPGRRLHPQRGSCASTTTPPRSTDCANCWRAGDFVCWPSSHRKRRWRCDTNDRHRARGLSSAGSSRRARVVRAAGAPRTRQDSDARARC